MLTADEVLAMLLELETEDDPDARDDERLTAHLEVCYPTAWAQTN